ncbi:hypothetical protein J588_1006 [Acinetobacter sp. 1578804]|nr:hypothetical protein J588_1006 [Acinetobacter sp. 1578804]
MEYQAIILLNPVGILLAKNIYHRSKFNRQNTLLPENKYLTHSIIIS